VTLAPGRPNSYSPFPISSETKSLLETTRFFNSLLGGPTGVQPSAVARHLQPTSPMKTCLQRT
jgi:hypothetical protein